MESNMKTDQLIERSPMRAVAAATRGGLDAGQLGVVMARAGVGKSALLVHVSLNYLLRGSGVLHVSLQDDQAHVRSFYDEIVAELAREAGAKMTTHAGANDVMHPTHARALVDLERNRVIHSCLGRAFGPDDLRSLLGVLGDVMHFEPMAVVLDGRVDAADVDADAWRALAQEANIRLWLAVRTHRDGSPSARDLAGRFDTAVALEPSGDDVSLHILRSGGDVFEQTESLTLDPVSMMVHPEDVRDPVTAPPSPAPKACVMYSGGATGAECAFGEEAERFGVREVNFTFAGHNQKRVRGRRVLEEKELTAGDVSLVYVAHRIHRNWDKKALIKKVLQTQWHVVSKARQVFVVGVIQDDNSVRGGTGWSVELARRWNKPVWVFDQERHAWFTWLHNAWVVGEPVIQTPEFAGTGTRFLSDEGRQAITGLFERSFAQ